MAHPNEMTNIRLISKVSSLYYNQELTQQEIADRLNLSRPKVSRLIKLAKERGIVKITVDIPKGNFVKYESAVEKKFNLKEAIIVEIDPNEIDGNNDLVKSQLGIAAANYLERTITDNDIIGVTWGTTLKAMIDNVPHISKNNIHVVQMLGGVGPPEAKAHAVDISKKLSEKLNSKLTLLQAPGIVDSPDTKNILLADKRISKTLTLFKNIDIAIVGIGAIKTNPVLQKENSEIPNKIQKEILATNAVGDIGLNFFNIHGKEVKTIFRDHFIGMSLSDLKNIKTVVGIACGEEKREAIIGALSGGFIDVLITDHLTAKNLLS